MFTRAKGPLRWRLAAALLALTSGLLPASPATAAAPAATEATVTMGGEAVVTNILWRIRLGGWDDMTSANIGEVNAYGTEGQVYYVPRYQYSGTQPLYRLRSPHSGDHMDSTSWNEGGYASEGVIGYPYASSSYAYGLSQYMRTYNRCNGDHGNRSYWEGLKPCYVNEPQPAYGWSRFLNAYSSSLINSAGGVTIESNRLKGGSLVHWTHNGTQYLNNFDSGRQLQSAVFYPDGSSDGEANPTEGGDRWTDQWRPPALRHGSPVLMATTDNHPTSPTQSTRSIPIDYEPQQIGGGPDNPVVYKDQILGKDITLNWRGFGPVARYHTRYLSPAISNARIEIPTGYLRADFNRFFIHDANSGGTAEIPPCGGGTCIPNNCSNQHDYFRWAPPNRGGVIIANGDGTRAMGVYGANVNVGGSVSEFYLATFFCGGSGDELSQATSKWSAIRYGNFGDGTKAFNTWVLSGTLDEVRANMNRLATHGDG